MSQTHESEGESGAKSELSPPSACTEAACGLCHGVRDVRGTAWCEPTVMGDHSRFPSFIHKWTQFPLCVITQVNVNLAPPLRDPAEAEWPPVCAGVAVP